MIPVVDLTSFRGRPPRELALVRDLEAFDGPILSEYRAKQGGGVYLEKACGSGDAEAAAYGIFLLVRSDQRAIAEYLDGRISMRHLLTEWSDGLGFIVARSRGNFVGARPVVLEEVPGYLPDEDVYHDETLRPSWAIVPHCYLLGEQWSARRLSELERIHQNATAFGYLAKNASSSVFADIMRTSNLDGGFSVAGAFHTLRNAVPVEQLPRSASISLNSPGALVVETAADAANVLEDALRALPLCVEAYKRLYAWSRLHSRAVEKLPPDALENVQELCAHLDVDYTKLLPNSRPFIERSDIHVAGKMIAAYYRMLRRVARPQGGVEFTGPSSDAAAVDFVGENDVDDADLEDDIF